MFFFLDCWLDPPGYSRNKLAMFLIICFARRSFVHLCEHRREQILQEKSLYLCASKFSLLINLGPPELLITVNCCEASLAKFSTGWKVTTFYSKHLGKTSQCSNTPNRTDNTTKPVNVILRPFSDHHGLTSSFSASLLLFSYDLDLYHLLPLYRYRHFSTPKNRRFKTHPIPPPLRFPPPNRLSTAAPGGERRRPPAALLWDPRRTDVRRGPERHGPGASGGGEGEEFFFFFFLN